MNKNDMTALVLPENDQVTVKNTTGTMIGQKAVPTLSKKVKS